MKRLSGAPCTLACVVLGALLMTGCGAAAQDPKAPVGFTTSPTYITIENRSGNALAEGLIELVPSGVLAPFRRERASNPARNETPSTCSQEPAAPSFAPVPPGSGWSGSRPRIFRGKPTPSKRRSTEAGKFKV